LELDPRTATPCRTVAFSSDGTRLVEGNYLGFVTLRDANTGACVRRFLAQTALIETIRFEPRTGLLLVVGAGFEGGRDAGVVKLLDPETGRRVGEVRAHVDDATDVIGLSGERRRVASVGLDRRVCVTDLGDPGASWTWTGYEDYLNTCSERPGAPGQLAVAGDSPFSYVLDADRREVIAKIDSPGDTNGLIWSDDGRYLVLGDDAGRIVYFDGAANWKRVGEARVGGAAKRMVPDPASPDRALVACYDGRVWTISRTPLGAPPSIAMDRRRGMWGINVAATATRIAVPTFFDRALLVACDASGAPGHDVGPEPNPTYGCNWVAPHPARDEVAVTFDDGRVRILDAATGRRRQVLGPDTASLLMGAAWHPTLSLLATVDFYGELIVYDTAAGRVAWRRDLGLGPGISVDFDPSGRWLAVGGYAWEGRVLALGGDGLPTTVQPLDAPNRGVVKSLAFAGPHRLLTATGDGALVVHDEIAGRFVATRTIRGTPPMELSNGVAASPDGATAYVVSRDQTVRAFDLATGEPRGTGVAHVRGVKTVHASECGRYLATGSYDRTVMLWDARDLSVVLPPVRLANSGVSCVRWRAGRVYFASFDGVIGCVEGRDGRLRWHRTAADTAEGG
jgi:WD40 repeat protein